MRTLTIILLLGLTCCNYTDKKSGQSQTADTLIDANSDTDKLPKTGELYNRTPEQLQAEREQDIKDSLTSIQTLTLALKIANKEKGKNKYILTSDTLDINFGYLFSSTIKHLIIKRRFPWAFNTDIYMLQDNKFSKVSSKEMALMAYVGDTIQDVNGDSRLDYLFHWYPMSGCCLRDVFDVFLQKQNGDFSDEIEFINPDFSAKERLIRGLCYGYSALLYKYRWNGYSVDTVEYIYFPDSTNGNHYIRRKHKNENEKGEIIKQLPDEYKKIGYGKY